MFNWWYKLKYGIINLITWFPVIWNDRIWDEYFIYKLLQKKLLLMEKHFRLYGNHVGHKEDARRMKLCCLLLERLANEDYTEQLDLEYHQKGDFEAFFKALNAGKPTITCHTLSWGGDRWHEYESYMIHQDLDYLFRILRKYIRGWWD